MILRSEPPLSEPHRPSNAVFKLRLLQLADKHDGLTAALALHALMMLRRLEEPRR